MLCPNTAAMASRVEVFAVISTSGATEDTCLHVKETPREAWRIAYLCNVSGQVELSTYMLKHEIVSTRRRSTSKTTRCEAWSRRPRRTRLRVYLHNFHDSTVLLSSAVQSCASSWDVEEQVGNRHGCSRSALQHNP
jgi:hypothetical protein